MMNPKTIAFALITILAMTSCGTPANQPPIAAPTQTPYIITATPKPTSTALPITPTPDSKVLIRKYITALDEGIQYWMDDYDEMRLFVTDLGNPVLLFSPSIQEEFALKYEKLDRRRNQIIDIKDIPDNVIDLDKRAKRVINQLTDVWGTVSATLKHTNERDLIGMRRGLNELSKLEGYFAELESVLNEMDRIKKQAET
jgi:hypothetical protein